MANGYIGKISALVTASTADLSRKLQGSTRDVNRFANSIQSQIAGASRSAQASLNGIFTPLQRIQRALVAGRGLNLIDSKQVAQIQRAVSVAEGINKPLAAATRQFEGLSAEVQAAFLPALDLAQRRAAGLNDLLARSGSVSEKAFTKTAERIGRVSAALQQLRQAQQITASAPSGNELQFTDPSVFAALQASAEARRKAASPEVVSSVGRRGLSASLGLGDQIRDVARLDELITQAAAKINSIRLTPQVDTSQLEAARGELSRLIALQGVSVEALNKVNERAQAGGAGGDVEALIKRERGRKQIEDQLAADAKARADAEIALLIRKERGNKQIEDQLAADAKARADAEIALLIKKEQGNKQIEDKLAADAKAREDAEIAAVIKRQRAAKAAADADPSSRVAKLTGDIGIDSSPGAGFGQAQRDIDALATRVGAVRQQLETLPNSIRTRFIPELQRAQAQLVRLQNSPAATVQAIENATQRVQRLEAAARRASAAFDFRQSFGGAGLRGIEEGLNQQALGGYTAQLQLLQQTLAGTSQAARGPAVVAFNNLRNAIADAMERGTLETEQTRRVVQQLTQDAVRATAAAAGISPRTLATRLQRAGDISRGAFGNIGLAAQQAAFAFEDFFSVTGGLDQRIRAAGNNISQLGFILGGTTGLVAGIAAALTSQAIVAFIKFANQNVETQDRVKTLNDALARQKSLVEELAQAFRSLGDSLTRGAFSPAAARANEFRKELDELIKKQKELRDARVADIDPAVQRERATQGSLQRRLEEEDNIGRRVALQQQIEASKRREREAAAAAAARGAASGAQAAAAINQSGDSLFERVTRGQEVVTPRDFAVLDEARRRAGQAGAARSPAEIRDALVAQRDALIASGFGESDARVAESIRQLEELIASLEAPVLRASDALSISILEGAKQVSDALTQAQESLSRAGAEQGEISRQADRAAEQLASIVKQLETASSDGVRQSLLAQQQALLEQASALRSAASSVEAFSAVLDRVSNQLADTVAGEGRGRADQARREDNRQRGLAEAGLGFPGDADAAQRQRERAEADARAAEDRRDRVRRQNDLRRELFERDAIAGQAGDEAQQAIRDRDDAQRRLDQAERSGDVAGANNARRDRDRAQGRLDRAFEASPSGRAAAARADELDRQEAARREREDSIARGRELGRSPAERAGRDLAQGLRDLESAFDDNVEGILDGVGGRPQDAGAELNAARNDFEKDRRRLIEDAQRSIAPAIFGLADQVANAVIQGPSRAALQATDVSTVEGSRELNRLLRGDDSARDQNLVELQKQSQSLDELVRIAREGGADIAN